METAQCTEERTATHAVPVPNAKFDDGTKSVSPPLLREAATAVVGVTRLSLLSLRTSILQAVERVSSRFRRTR